MQLKNYLGSGIPFEQFLIKPHNATYFCTSALVSMRIRIKIQYRIRIKGFDDKKL
jgi:hypothetical protein